MQNNENQNQDQAKTKPDFLTDRIKYIKGLKSKTEQQELLVLLAETANRTDSDEKKLKVLVRAEQAAVKAQKARIDAARVINAGKESSKKLEDRKKVLIGAMVLHNIEIGRAVVLSDASALRTELDKFLTRPGDRDVFGLAPLPERSGPGPAHNEFGL
jgi:hypothetical protein